jgi:hypothetical protein
MTWTCRRDLGGLHRPVIRESAGGAAKTPVTLTPGRLKLTTRSSLTGPPPPANTIETVVVAAALAANAVGVFATITSTGWLASLASAAGGMRAINRPIQFDYSVMAIKSPDGRCPLVLLRAGTVGRRMKVGGVRTVGPSTVRVPGGASCSSRLLRLPIRQSCERSCCRNRAGRGCRALIDQ